MPIQVKGLSKHFRLFKREAGLSGAFRSFFNRKYENFHALKNVSIHIEDGEILGILGENGAGKTTLIKLLVGLLHPSSGDIEINADGQIKLEDGSVGYGTLYNSSSNFGIHASVADKDIFFTGTDSSTGGITALTLDMSNAGAATFSGDLTVSGDFTVNGTATTVNTTKSSFGNLSKTKLFISSSVK